MFMRRVISYIALLALVSVLLPPLASHALTARHQYAAAESCYKSLRNHPARMKYRDNWLRCIDKFMAVYKIDPSGPWASAGLYRSGKLYLELYQVSYLQSDKQEAVDIFERVVKRYPSSAYRAKSIEALRSLSKSSAAASQTAARKAYKRAEACYDGLRKRPHRMKYRQSWLQCIEKYQAVHDKAPTASLAAEGLYKAGELYGELFKRSYRKSDQQQSLEIFKRVIEQYPDSEYKTKAAEALGVFPGQVETLSATAGEPSEKGAETAPADAVAAVIDQSSQEAPAGMDGETGPQAAGRARVTGLRYWSNPNYTRVVIDADQETAYQHNLLKKDPAIQKPQRLYVDLEEALLGKDTTKVIPINDNLLSDIRAGQYTLDSVRVVIDIKSFETYKIFSLKNPFRIVIDVRGEAERETAGADVTPDPGERDGGIGQSALARQLALGVSRIVIDAGHGGKDYGAPGYLKGVHEKYVVLDIAEKLAKKVKEQLGVEVIMTRTDDRHLTLEERTAIANTVNADLFISIHTNSARDRRAYGLETYILNLATDDEAIRVAARENATSTKNISDLQTILYDLMNSAKVNESSRLATYVQGALFRHLKSKYSRIKSKGVKQAPFYVLLGAQMPSILVETSFISNPRECKRLIDPRYQDQLCEAIIKGIRRYIRETNPTALKGRPQQGRSAG